jgi:hypothetical protein
MFVRVCPYFPFSARVCLNQHHWLARRMLLEGIDFEQTTNAFLKCGNPTRLQQAMSGIVDNYQNVQQDILETFVDRGQLRELAAPAVLANGKRIPGLKLDHPRQLALMHALVRFSMSPAGEPSGLPIYTHPPWKRSVAPRVSIRGHPFAMTCPS